MRITCPTCGEAIDESAIEAAQAWATCHACHGVVEIRNRPEVNRARRQRRLPDGFTLHRTPHELVLVRRDGGCVTLMLFIAVLIFAVPAAALLSQRPTYVHLVVAGLCALIAMAFLYSPIAAAMNRTTIRVTYDTLTLRHHPLPWPGNRTISAADIQSLNITATTPNSRDPSQPHHRLLLITADGRPVPLGPARADEGDEARFLKREIASFLGLRST